MSNGYSPSLSTQILLAASLGLTYVFNSTASSPRLPSPSSPILAFAQHLIFKEPFTRWSKDEDREDVKEGKLRPKLTRNVRMREKHCSSFIIGRPSITIDEWESDKVKRHNNHR